MTQSKNRIMIYGPKDDGTYVVEFKTAVGEALAISIPCSEAHVIRHFQERMPYGLFVPEVRKRITDHSRPQPGSRIPPLLCDYAGPWGPSCLGARRYDCAIVAL